MIRPPKFLRVSRIEPHFMFLCGRSLGGGGLELALRLLRRRPHAHLTLIERDWADVDRTRIDVAARGLDSRISVRPRTVLDLILP